MSFSSFRSCQAVAILSILHVPFSCSLRAQETLLTLGRLWTGRDSGHR